MHFLNESEDFASFECLEKCGFWFMLFMNYFMFLYFKNFCNFLLYYLNFSDSKKLFDNFLNVLLN